MTEKEIKRSIDDALDSDDEDIDWDKPEEDESVAVSYTHLTLPTIYSV